MSDSTNASMSMGLKVFVAFLIVATTAMCVMTLVLSRNNRVLRTQIEKLQAKTLTAGLIPGDLVQPLTLEDSTGNPFALEFGEGQVPTLVLLTSLGCGSCEETIPVWEGALVEAQPRDLRVVCVRAGALGESLADAQTALWKCYGTPPGREGWLRRIPVAPSAVLLDGSGRVVHRWFGHMTDGQALEMRMALTDIAGAS